MQSISLERSSRTKQKAEYDITEASKASEEVAHPVE